MKCGCGEGDIREVKWDEMRKWLGLNLAKGLALCVDREELGSKGCCCQ